MERVSATEASRRFSDLLDAVEVRREVFVVMRRGRAVAAIGPAVVATGARASQILSDHPPDGTWSDDLRELRDSLAGNVESWRD